MKPISPEETAQAMQRVRVGLTGLALVLVMIGLANAIFNSAKRDDTVVAIGASNAEVVANITDGNVVVEKGKDEPLAELGVAPSTATSTETISADAARRQREAAQAELQAAQQAPVHQRK